MNLINKKLKFWTKSFQRYLNYSSFLIFSFFGLFIFYSLISLSFKSFNKDNFWSNFAAACFGSIVAFGLNIFRENKKETENQHVEILNVQFILLAQKQFLFNLYDQFFSFLDRPNELGQILIKPISRADFPSISLEKISFILKTKNTDILNKILMNQRSFQSFSKLMDLRDKRCLKYQEETLLQSSVDESGMVKNSNIDKVIYYSFFNMSKQCSKSCKIANKANNESIELLNKFLKEEFLDMSAFSFTPQPELKEKYEEFEKVCQDS